MNMTEQHMRLERAAKLMSEPLFKRQLDASSSAVYEKLKILAHYRTAAIFALGLFILVAAKSGLAQPNITVSDAAFRREKILKALISGGVDMETLFPNPSDRIIQASFLRELLIGNVDEFKSSRHEIKIQKAVIEDALDLSNDEVPYDVALIDCLFQKDVDFSQTTFKKSLSIEGSEFRGSLNFLYCNIARQLNAHSAKFTSTDHQPSFEGLRIGDDANFNEAIFSHGANFNAVETGRDFQANLAKFIDPNSLVDFESMRVRNGLIRAAEFAGPVKFTGAEFAESLEANGSQFKNCEEGPRFDDMKVGTLVLDTISFCDRYPQSHGVRFDGMKFDRIVLREKNHLKDDRWISEHLITIPNKAEFNAQFYSDLEAYLKKVGEPERAEDLFLAYKRRERSERLTGLDKWKSYLFDALVAYGRQPWRAFLYGGFFFVAGSIVFRKREGMELEDDKRKPEHITYNPYWYSLDLLAPVIDLGTASVWRPKQGRRFARNYAHVQRIAGWVLIPIGLLALSGLLSLK